MECGSSLKRAIQKEDDLDRQTMSNVHNANRLYCALQIILPTISVLICVPSSILNPFALLSATTRPSLADDRH